jgi:hypothetical protein
MNGDVRTPVNGDTLLETFVAQLTHVAYHAALRTSTQGTWLDLELELWRALADTVKARELELAGCRRPARLLVQCSEENADEGGRPTAG